ncbi:MAG TPA: hypothetical protein VI160_10440, partial [Gemmatimonadales bacterium]
VAITQTATVVVNPGTPANLNFVVQPASATSGASIAPAIQVEVRDALNNRVTTAANQVTLAILNNAGGGTLSGTVTNVSPVSGVATFGNASIDKAGTGYTLTATATGLTSATSSAFNITAGAAAKISISAGDGQSATVNTNVATAPAVLVTDANGNPVAGVPVTFAIGVGGGSFSGTNPATTNASGIATLTSWTLGTTAGANTLTATATGFSGGGNPVTFTATGTAGAATQLVFTTQPTNTANGQPISPTVVVTAEDAFGNTDHTYTGTVTMTIATDPNVVSTLSGTTAPAAVAGVATFTNLAVNTLVPGGIGFKLGASDGTLTATSNSFNITP